MKKILLLVLTCLMLPRVAGAQELDGTFELNDLKYQSSSGLYYFDVSLNSTSTYSSYNLDIFFPTGITVAKDANDKPRVSLLKNSNSVYPYTLTYEYDDEDNEIEVKTYNHTIGSSLPNTNQLRLYCIDLVNNASFIKTSGVLFRVFVTIDNDYFASCFSPKPIVRLSGMNLTTKAEEKYVPADYACRPFTTGIPMERTLSVNVSAANKVGTLILPFDAALPQGLKAYKCNSTEGDLLTLTSATSIESCKPYIVYAENGYTGSLSGTATLPDATNVTDIFADGFLTGVLTNTVVSTGYILQNQGKEGDPKFYDAEGVEFSLPAGRCYFTPSTAGGARAFRFDFGQATGVDTHTVANEQKDDNRLFDLSGRHVSNTNNLQRGIYIKGTRKVVVR